MQIEEKDFVKFLVIKQRLAPKTVDSYRIRFLVVKRWLLKEKIELTKYSFESFLYKLKENGLSNTAINSYIQTVKHVDSFCRYRDLPSGFTEGIDNLPKTHPEIVILSVEEVKKLISTHLEYKNRNGVDCSSLDMKYLALTSFLALTGCRFEEAASLVVKRLDIPNGRATLVNTKNKHNRFVFFEKEIKEILSKLIDGKSPDELVFTNSRNQHVKAGDYNNDLRLRARKAGITKYVHAHLLRHSYGTHLVMAGVDISMVASLLGHKDIQTTYDIYVHLADETLQKASLRHPLTRESIDVKEIIAEVEEDIRAKRLDMDNRFKLSIYREDKLINIRIIAS